VADRAERVVRSTDTSSLVRVHDAATGAPLGEVLLEHAYPTEVQRVLFEPDGGFVTI
jgi:hypothetical protein